MKYTTELFHLKSVFEKLASDLLLFDAIDVFICQLGSETLLLWCLDEYLEKIKYQYYWYKGLFWVVMPGMTGSLQPRLSVSAKAHCIYFSLLV